MFKSFERKKVSLFFLFAIFVFTIASQSSEVTTTDDNINVNVERNLLSTVYVLDKGNKFMKDSLDLDEKTPKIFQTFANVFRRSIIAKCAKEKYQEFNVSCTLDEILTDVDNYRNIGLWNFEKYIKIYIGIGFLCSNKLQPIQEFIFDFLMSISHLIRALKDEPEFKESISLKCAHMTAIENNYWNLRDYGFETKLTKLNEGDAGYCIKIQEEINKKLESKLSEIMKYGGSTREEVEEIYFECMKKSNNDLISFLAKYILMLQIELTLENVKAEKKIFLETSKKLYEERLKCVMNFRTIEELYSEY
jgi:hypothetical protein